MSFYDLPFFPTAAGAVVQSEIAKDLENYYKKSETYSRTEIDTRLSTIPKFKIEVVKELPKDNISSTTVYLVPNTSKKSKNLYTEYIYIESIGDWEKLGEQTLDLSGYALKSEIPIVPTALSELADDEEHQLVSSAKKAFWDAKSEFSGKYSDLVDPPSIPSVLADLTDDANHRLVTDSEIAAWNAKSVFSGNYEDLTGKPTIPTIPTNISTFINDTGYLTENDITAKLNTALVQAKESGEFNGQEGFSPIVTLSKADKVTTISVTNKTGEETVNINDGTSVTISSIEENDTAGGSNTVIFSDGNSFSIKNGSNGSTPFINGIGNWQIGDTDTGIKAEGQAGDSVSIFSIDENTDYDGISTVTFSDNKTLRIKNGSKGEKGDKPVRGIDYLTEAEISTLKDDIVQLVLAALPTAAGEEY